MHENALLLREKEVQGLFENYEYEEIKFLWLNIDFHINKSDKIKSSV